MEMQIGNSISWDHSSCNNTVILDKSRKVEFFHHKDSIRLYREMNSMQVTYDIII